MRLLLATILLFTAQTHAGSTAQLETLIQRAQSAYFEGADPQQTFSYFEEIAALKGQQTWKPEEKKVIHFSMLRLAQLSAETAQQDHWLGEALEFAPKLEIDSEIFPPPLVKKYSVLKRQRQAARPMMAKSPPTPVNLQTLKPSTPHETQDLSATLPQPLNDSPSIFKNKWFWIGAGALLTGYLIYDHNQKRESEPAPTVTYGL